MLKLQKSGGVPPLFYKFYRLNVNNPFAVVQGIQKLVGIIHIVPIELLVKRTIYIV